MAGTKWAWIELSRTGIYALLYMIVSRTSLELSRSEWRLMNVQQTCSSLLYPCGHLSMDVTDSGRTWSGRLRTGHYSRQSCWQRVKVVIRTTDTCESRGGHLFEVQSRYWYVYHVLKPILLTTATSSTQQGSCRHASASTTLRPHPVQGCQYDLADCIKHVPKQSARSAVLPGSSRSP